MKVLSHIHSIMRGSVGGITYTANPFHAIIARARVSPVNPMTSRQAQIRGAFGDASVLFENLLSPDQQAWEDYAKTLEYQGPLGPYTLPGRQVCLSNVGTALYLDDRGVTMAAPTAEPPTAPGFLSLADLDVVAASPGETGFGISLRNNNSEGINAFSFRSIAFPSTRNRFKGPFLTESMKYTLVAPAATVVLYFHELNAGSVYFASVRAITAAPPFRISQLFILRAIAAATAP